MTRAGRSGLRLSLLVMAATAVALGVNLFLDRGPGTQVGLSAQTLNNVKTQPVASAGRKTVSHYRELMTSRSFQLNPAKPKKGPDLSRTKLPRLEGYRLVGVMAGPRSVASAVVEETGSGRQEMVGLGERLGAGILVAVLADRVVVEVNGQRRQLALPDKIAEEMAAVLTLKEDQPPTPGRRPLAQAGKGSAGAGRPIKEVTGTEP